jgi:hypothetical protein
MADSRNGGSVRQAGQCGEGDEPITMICKWVVVMNHACGVGEQSQFHGCELC